MKNFVLYNPMSNNNTGAEIFEKIKSIAGDRETVFEDITKISDIVAYLDGKAMRRPDEWDKQEVSPTSFLYP